ncbi:hypothetical protein DCAR_0624165 [Daucus carota subsp. sativus]|uniref:Disease resistance R13L4/SHOC-2-like LRR domain-containing protein n=1 Tax=Daucus carota subsp. sativus TaxID=79200 RepID=A0A161ZUX7_DAUCS|nr:PREDICTED: receptor-like protein kinase [Daucus carota subsp. sativus]WOH04753.1 hypothetical protein DCAR_0624165 [Daucus carota subsp. sativus]
MANSCTWNTCLHLLLIVSFAAAESSCYSSSSFETRKTETDALVSTGWWNPVPSFCTSCNFIGVECNKAGRVITINLGDRYYVGNDLGMLNISSFPYLQKLDLSSNRLTGSIPYQVAMHSKLKYLNLSNNYLTGKLDFTSFPHLQTLDLSSNGLTGSIPHQIGMLSKLKYLSVSNNDITGNLPSSLGNLTQLQMLDVSQNKLTGTIPLELGNLSHLDSLDLSFNLFDGSLDLQLANLTQL